ncbi:MAG TPA: type II toxin-antitoxin system VapC family toxin [Terriglobales bacterium]|nr:type II toxin-antitoxin system VapC family toxin [Terriglobales bacterium]
MIVLDASATVELLLMTPRGALVKQKLHPDVILHAPHLIDVEVAHVLRRMVRLGEMSSTRATMALQDFHDLDIARYPHEPLLRRIWTLKDNISAYDAAYVALAEALGACLITCDARLGSAPGHAAKLVLV